MTSLLCAWLHIVLFPTLSSPLLQLSLVSSVVMVIVIQLSSQRSLSLTYLLACYTLLSCKSVPLQKTFTPLTCSRFGIVRGNLLRFSGWLSFQSAPLMTAGRSQFLLTFENNNKADVHVPRREGAAGRCFCCSQPPIYARRSCFCLSGVNDCLLNPMNPLSLSL